MRGNARRHGRHRRINGTNENLTRRWADTGCNRLPGRHHFSRKVSFRRNIGALCNYLFYTSLLETYRAGFVEDWMATLKIALPSMSFFGHWNVGAITNAKITKLDKV